MTRPVAPVDQRYGDPDAVATGCDETRQVLESAQVFWISTVRADGRLHQDQDEGLEVVVFLVTPTKVLAFSRGAQNGQNSHTAHRF